MRRKIDLMHDKFGYGNGICKDCKHFKVIDVNGKRCRKCRIYGVTSSEASDWAERHTACGLYNKEYKGDKPIIELVTPAKRSVTQIDGQMSLF